MKRILIFILSIVMTCAVSAQRHALQLGVHAGADTWQTNAKQVQSTMGATAGLDIAYLCLGRLGQHTFLGPKIGVSVAFSGSSLQMMNYEEKYTNVDYYSENMDYTIRASFYRERARHLQLEVPLLLTLQSGGFTIGVGGKFMMPFSSSRYLDIRDPYVEAYYPDFEVPVPNELVTGKILQTVRKADGIVPQLNALLSAEVGYEWDLNYGRGRVGLNAYLDYSLWNNYSNRPTRQRLVDVPPILDRNYPVPDVKTNYLSDTYASQLKYLSVGLRLYYVIKHDPRPCYPCRLYWY